MSSIALFSCNHTAAPEVVDHLSSTLELRVYCDDDLIKDTCEKYDHDPVTRVAPEAIRHAIYNKTSVFNQFTLEKESIVNKVKSVLAAKLADQERYLFSGFLSLLVPQNVTHILKVLIVDTKSGRVDQAVGEGLSPKEAKRSVRSYDVSAYGWAEFLYKKEAYDKSLYDMVIPVKNKSTEEIADEIARQYHTVPVLRTIQSQKAIDDMVRAVEIERILLNNGHKLAVDVQGETVTLVVHKSVFSFSKLTAELTELVQVVQGVKKVNVVRGSDYDVSIYRKQKFELPSKVLFVDDEKEFVQTVSERLISRDVGTYGVYSGEDALELITEDRPDVMVLDLKMPGLHGVEVLRRTKEIAPEVEVIILTGHGTSEDMEQCMKLGAFAYMNKPVNIEELSDTIKKAYEKLQQREAA